MPFNYPKIRDQISRSRAFRDEATVASVQVKRRHLPAEVGREEGEKRGARREDMAMHTGVIPL